MTIIPHLLEVKTHDKADPVSLTQFFSENTKPLSDCKLFGFVVYPAFRSTGRKYGSVAFTWTYSFKNKHIDFEPSIFVDTLDYLCKTKRYDANGDIITPNWYYDRLDNIKQMIEDVDRAQM